MITTLDQRIVVLLESSGNLGFPHFDVPLRR